MSDVNDLIGFSIEKNPVDFADTFNNIMQQKMEAAIDGRRIELAQSVYGSPEEDVTDELEDDGSFDFSDEELAELDDSDFDDDLDIDDLDLDDLDLDLEDTTDGEDA